MAHDKEITITKDDKTTKIMASSLRVWQKRGWTAADDGSSEEMPTEPTWSEPPAAEDNE